MIAALKTVLRGQVAQEPWKANCPVPQLRVQTPHELRVYPVTQTHAPLEMTWLLPQV